MLTNTEHEPDGVLVPAEHQETDERESQTDCCQADHKDDTTGSQGELLEDIKYVVELTSCFTGLK